MTRNRLRLMFVLGTLLTFTVSGDSNGGSGIIAQSHVSVLQSIGMNLHAQCFAAAACGGGLGCNPVPTSLVPVNTAIADPSGWETAGGRCGFRLCLGFIPVPCGRPLSSGACI